MVKQSKVNPFLSLIIGLFISIIIFGWLSVLNVHAEDGAVQLDGLKYTFDKNNKYMCSKSENAERILEGADTYGTFSISGNIVNVDCINDIPIYGVSGEDIISLTYSYTDKYLKASNEEWHLVSDSCKEVDGISLNDKIQKGAIVIQTSKDGAKWVDTYFSSNVFENIANQTEKFYDTTDIQLKNGCYYKIYVVYALGKKTGWKTEYKRCAECYFFYAYNVEENIELEAAKDDLKYCFSEKINTGLDNGYSNVIEIDKNDPHFGWNLGEFYVRGYTKQTQENDGTIVFLENTGDKVVLYFDLLQDIDALNGNEKLSISNDDKGYDKYFEIPQTYMGRGTLIVRYTDYENKVHDPIIYTDYLSAILSPGADTMIELYGEGDYEVSLDYEIKNSNNALSIPKYTNYKIFFKFSIRNGKCMVYPMDAVTGSELSSSSYTENGFVLDLAYSRYLDLMVKRQLMDESGNLVEDKVFDNLAKNGSTFTEEGLYTITARNRYTDQMISKVIYVGTRDMLKAVAKSGLGLEEVKKLVDRGAEIDKYGNIDVSLIEKDISIGKQNNSITTYICICLGIAVAVLVFVVVLLASSRRRCIILTRELKEKLSEYENK